jgi:hypothetical protein
MERVIATHHHEGHQLDVIESIDEDATTIRLVVDGELLPVDAHPDRPPSGEEVVSLLGTWGEATTADAPAPQMPNRSALHPHEVIALLDALDEEHKAHATYCQVIADFGEVGPFVDIVESEGRAVATLTELMQRYEVPVPDNPWPGKVTRYGSVAQACADAVDAELGNAAIYDRLLDTIDRADICDVFQDLREVSQGRHLPAFRRCTQRSSNGEHHRGGQERHRHRGHE